MAAFAASVGATVLVALPCSFMSESVSATIPGGQEAVVRSCKSLLAYSVGAVLFFTVPPTVVTVVGATAAFAGAKWVPLIAGALLVQGGVVMSIFAFAFFPAYFLPAGMCLFVAGLLRLRP